jgi:hypothetical protein
MYDTYNAKAKLDGFYKAHQSVRDLDVMYFHKIETCMHEIVLN